ncbi:MAG: acetyl-CoA carboxylase biotin carboxylase subunit [Haliea sp.]
MNKILIANRGEIAVRVIRTARELGYRTVAVFSDADRHALHTSEADEAMHLGASGVSESYLSTEKLLQAAQKVRADAIHPGYGFLSENADFARACERAGITFIGPSADVIALMGSKRKSKQAMIEAGVPCIPGYQGEDQSEAVLISEALKIGFPLMIKASAGGGGRGMRLVHKESDLKEQLRAARSEAAGAFGNEELILERAVLEPRHIEIQVFADQFGNTVYLGERDCSIQRRHQKVVEEAPSPFVDEHLRARMGEAAVRAATRCNYLGAGTVEFLVDSDQNFYFLEMNTRLQVEHPVTEAITGLDLVAWQLMVAEGEALPLTQEQITLEGHAVEVRLYAEDPRNQFMPQTGQVLVWDFPERSGSRLDYGIDQGQLISPHYDPMLAKVISWGRTRDEAVRRLASTLQDTHLLGVDNNKHFLQAVLDHRAFRAGEATTAFIEQHFQSHASLTETAPAPLTVAKAGVLFFHRARSGYPDCSWMASTLNVSCYVMAIQDEAWNLAIRQQGDQLLVVVGENEFRLRIQRHEAHIVVIEHDGICEPFSYAFDNACLYVDDGSAHFMFEDITHRQADDVIVRSGQDIKAVMDGAVIDILVEDGNSVVAGQTVLVLEAMKMEHPLKATVDGVLELACSVGQQVRNKQVLASVKEPEGAEVS